MIGERNAAIDRAETAERRLSELRSETGFLPGNHCVYCGAMSRYSVCPAHRDVARIDWWIGL